MKKAIFTSIAIIFIGLVFIAFNFYASRMAEDQINQFFKKQVNVPGNPVNIHYSKVKVPVFGGRIYFSNVTIQSYDWAVKIDRLQLKLGYFKLFRFFISKTKNALKHTRSVDIHAEQVKVGDTKKQAYLSIASIDIHQNGNLWEATKSIFLSIPLQNPQSIKLQAIQLRYKNPGSNIGVIKSDSAYVHYVIPGVNRPTSAKQDSILFSGITWKLPKFLKNRYGMFLAGFGFSTDSIQVARAGFSFSSLTEKRIYLNNGIFKTDPLTVAFNGMIIKKTPWSTSKLAPVTLTVVKMTDNLRNLLIGFGFIKQGKQQDKLSFQLVGPIRSPHLEK